MLFAIQIPVWTVKPWFALDALALRSQTASYVLAEMVFRMLIIPMSSGDTSPLAATCQQPPTRLGERLGDRLGDR